MGSYFQRNAQHLLFKSLEKPIKKCELRWKQKKEQNQ